MNKSFTINSIDDGKRISHVVGGAGFSVYEQLGILSIIKNELLKGIKVNRNKSVSKKKP